MRSRLEIVSLLTRPGIVAVVRTERREQIPAICESLLAGGVLAVEITLTVPDAIEAIREANARFGSRALIGAGTVLNADACRTAIGAGAEFVISPITKLEILQTAHAADRPVMLGAYTPTEAHAALHALPIQRFNDSTIQPRSGLYVWQQLLYRGPMTTPNQQVRRATIEDLQKLVLLWQQENLPCQQLEKRFKEFQVVEGEGGELLGATGLQITGHEGYLHSEAFAHAEQADGLREKLWERSRIVAGNFGLVRIWTQLVAPFWNASGFQYAPAETLAKLPPQFAGDPHPWKFIQLKPEVAAPAALDKEFAMFKEAERERTEQMFRQARILKIIAGVIAIGAC